MKEIQKDTQTPTDKLLLSEFQGLLFEKIVPLKDLYDYKGKPMQKIIAYWRRVGLLPFVAEGEWMEISFAQLIWLRILDDLRAISFPLPKMKEVCDYFFKDAYSDNLPRKNLLHNRDSIKKKVTIGSADENDIAFLAYVENILKYDKALHILHFDVNYLSNLIATSVATGNEAVIYVFFDGRIHEFIGNNYAGHRKNDLDRTAPHICLNITHYLKELIYNDELSELFMPQVLNEEEQNVIREMRRKNVREISITKSNDNKPRIQATTDGIFSDHSAKEIKEMLAMKNYERIIIETLDEKTLIFKRTNKKI